MKMYKRNTKKSRLYKGLMLLVLLFLANSQVKAVDDVPEEKQKPTPRGPEESKTLLSSCSQTTLEMVLFAAGLGGVGMLVYCGIGTTVSKNLLQLMPLFLS